MHIVNISSVFEQSIATFLVLHFTHALPLDRLIQQVSFKDFGSDYNLFVVRPELIVSVLALTSLGFRYSFTLLSRLLAIPVTPGGARSWRPSLPTQHTTGETVAEVLPRANSSRGRRWVLELELRFRLLTGTFALALAFHI